jgi:hypothetical protein
MALERSQETQRPPVHVLLPRQAETWSSLSLPLCRSLYQKHRCYCHFIMVCVLRHETHHFLCLTFSFCFSECHDFFLIWMEHTHTRGREKYCRRERH